MHPIEHLRYLARAKGVDSLSLASETAQALAYLRADHANLVIACRRILERHPDAAPLWWLCTRLLTADDPASAAWDLVDEIDDDATPSAIAGCLPEDATVLTIGFPETAGSALVRRPDVRVLCADSRHEASSFLQRLERHDVVCDPVPTESLARAAADADLVLVDALAASPERVLTPVGSGVVAAVAAAVDTPVWLAVGLGRRLPLAYVERIAGALMDERDPWDVDVDELAVPSVSGVVSADGLTGGVAAGLSSTVVCAPELLRVDRR